MQLAETAAEIGSKAGDKNGGRSEWQDDTRILNQPKAELRRDGRSPLQETHRRWYQFL